MSYEIDQDMIDAVIEAQGPIPDNSEYWDSLADYDF